MKQNVNHYRCTLRQDQTTIDLYGFKFKPMAKLVFVRKAELAVRMKERNSKSTFYFEKRDYPAFVDLLRNERERGRLSRRGRRRAEKLFDIRQNVKKLSDLLEASVASNHKNIGRP